MVPAIRKTGSLLRIICVVAPLAAGAVFNGCNRKQALFEKVDKGRSNILFENKNEDTDSLNILDYLYYYNGAGVAVGDVNNDGLPDIYFAANQGGNKLYLNKGDFVFEDITEKAGVKGNAGWTTGVTMADVNGDGLLDIYVCAVANHTPQFGGNTGKTFFPGSVNQLFINKGNLTFSEEAAKWGIAVKGYCTQSVFFDFDKDNDLDLFVLEHSTHQTDNYGDSSARSIYSEVSGGKLFRNEGDHFIDITRGSGIISSPLGYGLGIACADFNNDGWDDLYVGNDFHENDYYYINQKDGHFLEMNQKAFGHQSNFSMGNDAADLNNDGWTDIVTLDMLPEDEKELKSSVTDRPLDVYNDQHARGYNFQNSKNCLQLNTGRGMRFSEIALYSGIAATDWSWSVLAADFNLDGYKDIFVTNGIKKRQNDLDYIKFLSSGNFPRARVNSRSQDKNILAHQPEGRWHNYMFQGDSTLQYRDVSSSWGFAENNLSNGAAYADLDNDGDLDLVTNNINEPASIYRNNSVENSRGNYLRFSFRGSGANVFGIGTKVFVFCGSRLYQQTVQPCRGFMSSVDTRLVFGLGASNKADSIVIIWPDSKMQTIVNQPANRELHIVQADAQDSIEEMNGYISLLINDTGEPVFRNITDSMNVHFAHKENDFDDFNRQWLIPHQVSTAGPKIAVGDVNDDGLEDFYICGAKKQAGKLYFQKRGGGFEEAKEDQFLKDSLFEEVDAIFLDADNDKDLDLYLASGGNEYMSSSPLLADRLYLNDGNGRFTRSSLLPFLPGNKSVARAADFDGDGDMDIFVGGRVETDAYGNIPSSYLLQNDGKGNYSIVTDRIAPGLSSIGMVTSAEWADFDGDGYKDLIVAGEWMAPEVFYNEKGKLIRRTSTTLKNLTGWWCSLAICDIDGDGDEDVLAGNYGLNSKLKASQEYPLRMYAKDIDGNGKIDRILALQKKGRYYPFLPKEDLEKQLPYLKKEYLSYSKMAGKTVEEIFSSKLDDAKVFAAAELSSMLLLNDGKGNFAGIRLPGPVQMAPIYSFFTSDFNHDGKMDFLAGGNFTGVKPYEGRYDALLPTLCYGNNKGGFNASLPYENGLLIEGEIRDIKKLILVGGRHSLVIARNNNTPVFLIY